MLQDNIAKLISFVCESMLYGVYCVLFMIASALLLWYRRPGDAPNFPIIFANTILFLVITAYWGLDFTHFYTTLQTVGVSGYGAETRITWASDILIQITDLLGDLILIYRCWHVWGRNYFVIIPPLLTSIAGFTCIIINFHILSVVDLSASHFPAFLVPLGTAAFTLQLCTNVLVTSLIAIRIWYTTRELALPGMVDGRPPWKAMIIVIESGALYLVFQLVFLVLFALQHPAQQIVIGMALMVYGIAPTLIIIRVALRISSEHTVKESTLVYASWILSPKPQVKRRGSAEGYMDDNIDLNNAQNVESDLASTQTDDLYIIREPYNNVILEV